MCVVKLDFFNDSYSFRDIWLAIFFLYRQKSGLAVLMER